MIREELHAFVETHKIGKHEGYDESRQGQFRQSLARITGDASEGHSVTIEGGGQHVVLNEYLPAGIRFVAREGAKFRYYVGEPGYRARENQNPPRIEFPPERLNTLGGRLALLHEIAHTRLERAQTRTMSPYNFMLLDIAGEIADRIRESNDYQAQTPESRDNFFITEFKKEWLRKSNEEIAANRPPLRYEDLNVAIRQLIPMERSSWAEALKLRNLIQKKHGIDILEGASKEAIFAHIEAVALRGYQETYGPLLQLAGGDNEFSPRSWLEGIFDYLYRSTVR